MLTARSVIERHIACFPGVHSFGKGNPMGLLRSPSTRCLLLAAALLLPRAASATSLGAMLNTTGTNTMSVQLLIQCSGNALVCAFAGLGGSGYNQTQTSTLSGTSGLFTDDVADTLQLSSDAAGTTDLLSVTGTNVTFTGLNTTLTGGPSSVTVSSLVSDATNAGLASILGYSLPGPQAGIPFSMSGAGALSIGANGVTNAPNIPTISLAPTPVNTLGTFVSLGDPDVDLYPNFQIQNLRGNFQSITTTITLGVTIRITLRATFTLNLIGESLTQIPEPASLGLVGLGIAGFGFATQRRGKRS
jgi:hypothetical protein